MTSRLAKPRTTTHAATLALVLAIALAIGSGCNPPETNASLTWRFDCPKDSVLIQLVKSSPGAPDSVRETITDIPLSEPVTDIPEYHDCQRFILPNGYGSTFAVFAAFRLDKLSGGPFATIYTPDGTYPELGIQAGFNCLFLTRTGQGWKAQMVPWGLNKNDCTDNHITVGPGVGKELTVRMQNFTGSGFTAADYPPVARWDRDTANGHYYLGILCGGAWCEIGETGFAPSPVYNGPTLTFDPIPAPASAAALTLPPTASARVQQIKGWYDVQYLGASTGGSPHPTTILGTLIPHPALDMINWTRYRADPHASLIWYRDRWVHVGYAVMTGDYSKWNLKAGINKMLLCFGTADAASCGVPLGSPLEYSSAVPLSSCPTDPTDNTRRWWAKTVSKVDPTGAPTASSTTTYSCVRRMDHRAHLLAWEADPQHANLTYRIPGSARWYFMPNDEGTWHSCPTGCCSKL